MLKLQQDINNAKTTEQRLLAEEAQKQMRITYGASSVPASASTVTARDVTGQGGTQTSFKASGTTPRASTTPSTQTPAATGAQPSTTDSTGSTGSFAFSGQQQLDNLIDQTTNRDPFSYNPAQDESYKAARKAYLREAERAREDTMAKAAAGTGGTPSSYAVTAAQQAGDYHLTQFADRVGTLEQNAYQRYLNEAEQNLNAINVLTGQRDFDYAAYLNQVEQDQANFQNALALYEQYKNKMTPDQLAQLFTQMGYMSPALQTFLSSIKTPTGGYYGGSGGSSSRRGGNSGNGDDTTGDGGLLTPPNVDLGTREGQIAMRSYTNQVINAGLQAGVITQEEAAQLRDNNRQVR